MIRASHPRKYSAILLVTALAMLSVSGCTSPPPPREAIEATVVELGESQAIRVDQAVILLDASGSMQPGSRFGSTQNLASSFVAGMPEAGYSAAVVVFGGDTSEILEFAPFDRDEVDSAVVDTELLGKSTDIASALGEVEALLADRTGSTAIVLFSDGVAARYGRNIGHESTLAAAKRIVSAARSTAGGEVCFHTIQSAADPAGTVLMESLAAVTACGEYRHADSLADAQSLLALEQIVFVTESLPAVSAPPPAPVFVDADRDGVSDDADQCLDTPEAAFVNELGCWVLDSYTFEPKKWNIEEDHYGALDRVAAVLRANPGLRIRVDGHTDSVGTAEYNQTLSEWRAGAVRSYLEATGIASGRLETRGFGKSEPVSANDTPAGMAKNRRCQLTILR